MGSSKSTETNTNTTQTPTPTAEETEMNKLALERERANQQGMIGVQGSGLSLINQLLTGQNNLPGFFGSLSGGINEQATQGIVQQSLRDLYPQFQGQGILDSGTAASAGARTAGDIRTNVAQYNQQNLMQLLNLALSGSTSVQQPILNQSSILGQRLAGLRSINQQGSSTGKAPSGGMGNMMGGALSGAASGAMIGSVIPGIGTLGGAIGGGLIGGVGGIYR
jgi:hypothetical protein